MLRCAKRERKHGLLTQTCEFVLMPERHHFASENDKHRRVGVAPLRALLLPQSLFAPEAGAKSIVIR
jgi:hypothetical protein